MSRDWRKPWIKAFYIGIHLAAHLATALILIFVISLVQLAVKRAGDPHLLDFIPIRYMFDVLDLGLLAQFLFFGTISAYRAFKDSEYD